MNRRQALLSSLMLIPFGTNKEQQSGIFTYNSMQNYYVSYNFTNGILTIANKVKSITISLDEIMDALESK